MPVTNDEIVEALLRPMEQSLSSVGITPLYLAKKLKRELNAKEIKVFNDKGNVVYSKNLVAWHIRQKARQDAHKLLDHYPAEKHELFNDKPITLKIVYDEKGPNGAASVEK